MRVLLIGANSYIAKAFIRFCSGRFEITALSRGPDLPSYFDLNGSFFAGVDVVVNFAAIVHKRHPGSLESKRINAELPVYLASLAKHAGVSHFIQFSTIAVYGRCSHIDMQTPTHPETVYGRSKLEGDEGVRRFGDAGFTVSIVRPPVVYGPNAPGNMQALQKLLSLGIPLPFAYGKNSRSILYVGNLAEALARIIERRCGGVFLLRDRHMPSLAQIAGALRSGSGVHTPFFPLPRWLAGLLCSLKRAPFERLYGDLVIDDSYSLQTLGEYAATGSVSALQSMAKGAWA
jgi:nucleoside-diphosphate-sugar epimerase